MGAYQIPGVYPQDVAPLPKPTLLTGVPAFLGLAATGPRTPQQLTLWPQFEAIFGDGFSYLAEAVRGFFGNDGTICYAVRLDETAAPLDRVRAGLSALDDLDDVDLVAAPGIWAPDDWLPGAVPSTGLGVGAVPLQRLLTSHCRARGDRFAILDALPGADPAAVAEHGRALTGPEGAFGALYHPWFLVDAADGTTRFVPPSGHVAGVYSRGDQQIGVHKAPANEVVDGVMDVASVLTATQVGALCTGGVNCVRALPGRGIRVWGARTMASDPTARDVSARRVVGTIGRFVERFMTQLVFEPHDMRLRVRVMRELTAYLDGLYAVGALRGQTASEAFYVKCDDETNLPDAVAAGLCVTQIGVAPSVPAEFVVVRVIHGASGVQVDAA